jgi:hypothetical protein
MMGPWGVGVGVIVAITAGIAPGSRGGRPYVRASMGEGEVEVGGM